MKRQSFILAFAGILCFAGQYAFGQISEGGTPVSFSSDINADKGNIPALMMPAVDTKSLLREDEKARQEGAHKPFRFGCAIDVDIDVKKDGVQKELPNGDKLWLLKIHSPDAVSINLIYDQFRLGKGSKFFIYNEERTTVLGAFTPETSNNPYNEFATDLVQGNTVVLEYYEPASSDDGVIHISKVIHGYADIAGRASGDAADCNIDVKCTLGNGWGNETRAVCLIIMGEHVGSGCLVNNTQQDFTPYILTAHHNYYNDYGIQIYSPATSIFRFQYSRAACGVGNPYSNKSITGATLRAHSSFTDFALLELSRRPPTDYNVYYAGWDKTGIPAQNATAIHHPREMG